MASLPVQVLFGLYLGVLTGIVPALLAWALGFTFKYVTGVTIPGFGVVVLSLAVAGVNGGLLALNDPAVLSSDNAIALVIAIVVVLMLTFYAHAKGDQMGASLPKRLSLRALADRKLSAEVVELVGGRGQVRVTVAGDVADMEGYPALSPELRERIADATFTFPADRPLPELERETADRLRAEFDLVDVEVRLDERARATVAAAPPLGGLSARIPDGKRAVSVSALLPTGLARGDDVRAILADGRSVAGTVVSAVTRRGAGAGDDGSTVNPATDGTPATDGGVTDPTSTPAPTPPAPTTTGGPGRVTLAVDRGNARSLLEGSVRRLVVEPKGTRREFELTALLRRAGKRFRKLTVREEGVLDGTSLRDAAVRETFGVAVLAARVDGRWRLAPDAETTLAAGDEVFAVGSNDALGAFAEAVA